MHGEETARRLADSFRAGVDRLEKIVRDEQIDCSFIRLDGWWFPSDDEGRVLLRKEREAARKLGFPGVDLVEDWPLGDVAHGPALRFPHQAQFHALRYLSGLARAVERLGGIIRTGVHVTDIEDGDPCVIRTDAGHVLRANEVVVATNTPVNDRVTMHTKQSPYRTYVVGMNVPRGAVATGLYWDTREPYHYIRLFDRTATARPTCCWSAERITRPASRRDPRKRASVGWSRDARPLPVADTVYRWSGQVMEPVDISPSSVATRATSMSGSRPAIPATA